MTTINPTTPGANVSEIKSLAPENRSVSDLKEAPKGKFNDVLKRIIGELTQPALKPISGNPERSISLNGISAGKGDEININLGSGGGFAQVTLTKEGARFTMGTPAYFSNAPGITTQNTLEFNVDFSDLSPKRHAQLINELKSALTGADGTELNKSEAALVDNALEILNAPDVCMACTVQSGIDAIKELIQDALKGADPEEIRNCQEGFTALLPNPVVDTYDLPKAFSPEAEILFKSPADDFVQSNSGDSKWTSTNPTSRDEFS